VNAFVESTEFAQAGQFPEGCFGYLRVTHPNRVVAYMPGGEMITIDLATGRQTTGRTPAGLLLHEALDGAIRSEIVDPPNLAIFSQTDVSNSKPDISNAMKVWLKSRENFAQKLKELSLAGETNLEYSDFRIQGLMQLIKHHPDPRLNAYLQDNNLLFGELSGVNALKFFAVSPKNVPVYVQNELGDLLGSYAYLDGILAPNQQPHFDPRKTGRSAEFHTEPKVMEEVAFILDGLIARYINDPFELDSILGEFRLEFYTVRYPCPSCQKVIGEFINLYWPYFGSIEIIVDLIEISYGDPFNIQQIRPEILIEWANEIQE
jgi:hypothetical protein